jgi:hypothetical protein
VLVYQQREVVELRERGLPGTAKRARKSKQSVFDSMRTRHNHDAKYAHGAVEQWWRGDMVLLGEVERYK